MPVYKADQDAVGSGYQRVLNIVPLEIIRHLANPEIRPERHWPRVHHLLNPALRVALQRLRCDESQHDTISIYGNYRFRCVHRRAIPDIADTVFKSRRRNITRGDIPEPRNAGVVALARQSGSKPVGLPRLIPIDGKPESLEPRRGPCAHVSLVVMAVGNDGSAGVESLGGLWIQVLQWDVDGTGNVFGLVFPRSEDIDELSTLLRELLDTVTVGHRGHVYFLGRLDDLNGFPGCVDLECFHGAVFDYGLVHALPTSKIKYASGRLSYCTHTRSALQTCSGATAISEFLRYGAYTMMCG